MQLKKLQTETRNQNSLHLDTLSPLGIIQLMNQEDKQVAYHVEKELASISVVIEKTIEQLKNGGRLIYCGAGTSGRIAVLDAVECPPTFGFDPKRVVALLAGSNHDFAKEEAEDSVELGKEDLKLISLSSKDILIGIAASGRTPYVIGALDYANEIGAVTVAFSCNKSSEISKHATYKIEVENGPEVLTGSTRLKAGTSQKMVLNMITTASMISLGKVYENLMVDVEASNEKLVERWKHIVMEATGCDYAIASHYYHVSHMNAKIAIIMILNKVDFESANHALDETDGSIRKVLAKGAK